MKNMQARREQSEIFIVVKRKNSQSKIIYCANLFFKGEGEMEFSSIHKTLMQNVYYNLISSVNF